MPINASDLAHNTFTTKATFHFEKNGERRKEDVRIVYRAVDEDLLEEIQKLPEDQRDRLVYQLPLIVKALPDVADAEGREQQPTIEFFRKLAPVNRKAIMRAVEDDSDPK